MDFRKPLVFFRLALGLVLLGLLLLLSVVGISEYRRWDEWLKAIDPAFLYAFRAALVALILGSLMLAWNQGSPYFRLRTVNSLKRMMEQVHSPLETICELTVDQERAVQKGLKRYMHELRQSGAISGEDYKKMDRQSTVQEKIVSFRTRVLPVLDDRARDVIERHARAVAVSTALSPSGLIDSLLVLWRNSTMIAETAAVYGIRPGLWGTALLSYRITMNVATAAVTQESVNMLHLAYGPKMAEAIGKAMEGLGTAIAITGGAIATAIPPLGLPVAVVGGLVKSLSRGAGQAAEVVSGPILQGILTAVLTIRIGLEVQRLCRVIPMTEEERASQTATLARAIRNLFLRQAASNDEVSPVLEEAPSVSLTMA